MTQVPYPVTSTPGRRAQEGGGRLINCYAVEVKGAPARQVIWTRAAGLRPIALNAEHVHCRGFVAIGSILLVVLDGQVYSVVETGGSFTLASLGPLAGSDRVTIAQNNATPTPNTVCVSSEGTFNLFSGSGPTAFADGDLITPNSVSVLNGLFVWTTAGGVIQTSEQNSVSVSSLATLPLPEGALLRGVVYRNEFYAFGPNFFRVYRDAGLSPFPLQYTRIKRDVGIIGTHAVAGWEQGGPGVLIWVGDDKVVYQMEGNYTPSPISEQDVQDAIESAADPSLLEASIYTVRGLSFFVLTNPGAWSWEYNISKGLWHERASWERDDWRGRNTINHDGRWLVGDDLTGNVYEISSDVESEDGDPLPMIIYSGILSAYPNRLNAVETHFRYTAGQGDADGSDPIETKPRVEIATSLDGGQSFSDPLMIPLGGEGAFDAVVSIGTTGDSNSHGIQFRQIVYDPVPVGFMGAEAVLEELAA